MDARRTYTAYLFLAPALLLLGVFTFYPVVFGTALSLFEYDVISPPRYVGMANFSQLWSDRYFWIALENSVKYLAVVPVIQFCSIVLALWVRRPAARDRVVPRGVLPAGRHLDRRRGPAVAVAPRRVGPGELRAAPAWA